MELILKIEQLSFAYRKNLVLSGINLALKPGEFTCLLGPNASGKTTLLKCLNGIYRNKQGKIYLGQRAIGEMKQGEIARYISMVPQEHAVIFAYRVFEIVLMGITPYLSLGQLPDRASEERAERILGKMGILHLARRYYNCLSGGERQLVLIARALMQETTFLVMDEPTAHLDFKNRYLLMEELKKLARAGKGVIVALHDPNLAQCFADRIAVLKEGKIIAGGNPAEVLTAEVLSAAYGIGIRVNANNRGIEVVLPE